MSWALKRSRSRYNMMTKEKLQDYLAGLKEVFAKDQRPGSSYCAPPLLIPGVQHWCPEVPLA